MEEKEIRVEYLFVDEYGKPTRKEFDYTHVMTMVNHLQRKYKSFADKINSQNGYFEITFSDSPDIENGIRFRCLIKGITRELNDEIELKIPSEL